MKAADLKKAQGLVEALSIVRQAKTDLEAYIGRKGGYPPFKIQFDEFCDVELQRGHDQYGYRYHAGRFHRTDAEPATRIGAALQEHLDAEDERLAGELKALGVDPESVQADSLSDIPVTAAGKPIFDTERIGGFGEAREARNDPA